MHPICPSYTTVKLFADVRCHGDPDQSCRVAKKPSAWQTARLCQERKYGPDGGRAFPNRVLGTGQTPVDISPPMPVWLLSGTRPSTTMSRRWRPRAQTFPPPACACEGEAEVVSTTAWGRNAVPDTRCWFISSSAISSRAQLKVSLRTLLENTLPGSTTPRLTIPSETGRASPTGTLAAWWI